MGVARQEVDPYFFVDNHFSSVGLGGYDERVLKNIDVKLEHQRCLEAIAGSDVEEMGVGVIIQYADGLKVVVAPHFPVEYTELPIGNEGDDALPLKLHGAEGASIEPLEFDQCYSTVRKDVSTGELSLLMVGDITRGQLTNRYLLDPLAGHDLIVLGGEARSGLRILPFQETEKVLRFEIY